MERLQLPRLLSDGMVLQQKKRVRIWGEDEPGRRVTVSFLGKDYSEKVNSDGTWEIFMEQADTGSDYQMLIADDAGEEWEMFLSVPDSLIWNFP